MSKLRIALTHVFAWPEVRRGGERYLHELAGALAKAGHEVIILSTAQEPGRQRILDVDVRYLRRHDRLGHWFWDQGVEVLFAGQALARLTLRRLDVWHALGTADAAAAALLGGVRNTRSVYTDLGIPMG
ncbi:MAG: glycosyltransferase, partial [Actinomycetota bacterium]